LTKHNLDNLDSKAISFYHKTMKNSILLAKDHAQDFAEKRKT
jgi:hypothetical protein